jgi:hypothetical protein
MMTVERLHELFESHPNKNTLEFEGPCHDCSKAVKVSVSLTAGGFAIEGGALYEPASGAFFTKCEACFAVNRHLSRWRKCEVYSRVVGYLRPVGQWNEGKQAEYADRKPYGGVG